MAIKAESVVFQEGDAVKQFILGQNHRVVSWIADNWERLDDLTGPVHKSTVSKALSGTPVVKPVADALDIMFDEIRDDPWAWCEPPKTIDRLSEYAPLSWWYKILELKKSIPWSRFERMAKQPLKAEDAEYVQERLDDWRKRLKAACVQFKADRALVCALESDEDPEFQKWVFEDEQYRIVGLDDGRLKPFRRRVGNEGLHGRSDDEIGRAWALANAILTLPDVEKAALTYSQPECVPVSDHYSEPVEPWNGDEFEGVEVASVDVKHCEYGTTDTFKVKHRVCFYWNGQRYLVEDVEPFAWLWEGEWREPTQEERDLLETGMTASSLTKAQFEAQRGQWIERAWKSRNENLQGIEKIMKPDGISKSEVEADFQSRLDAIDDEKAHDEQREIARRRMAFKRRLRRRETTRT